MDLARRCAAMVGIALLLVAAGGCADPEKAAGFDESDPLARMRAVRHAAETKDPAAVKPLIKMLDSDDPAERMLAIRTLEEITHQTFGYDHAAPRPERDAAVRRWVEWYGRENPPSTAARAGSGGGDRQGNNQ